MNNRLNTSKWICMLAVVILTGLQAYVYYARLPLSLGPRVILQPALIRDGYRLYENIADEHTPLLSILLTTFSPLVPEGLRFAKLALIVLLSATTLITFFVAKRTVGWLGGLIAVSLFVLWSPAMGFGKLWHESLLAPLYLLIFLLYEPPAQHPSVLRRLLWGLIGGIAILAKQHALLIVAALIVWQMLARWRQHNSFVTVLQDAGLITSGTLIPLAVFAVGYAAQGGDLRQVWFWTIEFHCINQYAQLGMWLPNAEQIQLLAVALILLPAAVVVAYTQFRNASPEWHHTALGFILLAGSTITVYPLFEFFHLQPFLPWLAWASALVLIRVFRPYGQERLLTISLVIGIAFVWLGVFGSRYIVGFGTDPTRRIHEYSDLIALSYEIRAQIGDAECIYNFPDDEATANLYFLMNCPPPRFWVMTYPWFMLPSVKSEMLEVLRAQAPEWIVYYPRRWDIERYGADIWEYIQQHYARVAPLHWAQNETWLFHRNTIIPSAADQR